MTDRTASCACGQLKLAIAGEPEIVAICGCRQCQLRTGSAYSAHAFFPESCVTIDGESRTFTRSSDSGRNVTFHFCPDCGSTVFWKAEGRPHSWGVAHGAFSGPDLPSPVAAVWTETLPDWAVLPEAIPAFAQGAPAPPPK